MSESVKVKIFKNIKEILTLKGAALKEGRSIEEKDLSIVKNGAIVSCKGIIQWVGPEKKINARWLKQICGDQKLEIQSIDLKKATVMPAFTECHTHSVFAGNRNDEFEMRNRGVSYQEIAQKKGGILSTVQSTRKALEKELENSLNQRALVFLRQGVTTLEVKSGYGLDLLTEVKMLKAIKSIKKIRTSSTFLGLHALPPEHKTHQSYTDFVIKTVLPKVVGLASRVDMFVEKGYFSLDQAELFFNEAKKLKLDFTIHADQLSCQGAGLWASQNGAVSADHLVEMNSKDIETFSKSETTAVFLPAADFYLKLDYPKARQFIDHGARVALATDFNPGSSPTQDLSFVGLLARLEMKMTLPEVIVAYTLGASYALGYGDQLGALTKGRFCDFIILDSSCSWKDLFYSVGEHPVSKVWREAKLLF